MCFCSTGSETPWSGWRCWQLVISGTNSGRDEAYVRGGTVFEKTYIYLLPLLPPCRVLLPALNVLPSVILRSLVWMDLIDYMCKSCVIVKCMCHFSILHFCLIWFFAPKFVTTFTVINYIEWEKLFCLSHFFSLIFSNNMQLYVIDNF